MSRVRFSTHECPVARGLDQIGDWWTLLVVRELMYGLHQFNDIRDSLGISRAVLAGRLAALSEHGIVTRHSDPTDARATHYRLTPKGRDLWPVIVALLTWSNAHVLGADEDVVHPLNPDSDAPFDALYARDKAGHFTALSNMVLGSGASASLHFRRRIAAAFPPPATER